MKDVSASEIRSTCAYCGVGCGVLLGPDGQGGLSVRGDSEHPANFGRLCSKGTNLGETLGMEDRLLHPMLHGKPVSWDAALDLAAEKFRAVIEEHGPDAVAFYVSGQLLTEDYYVANKLMKGFIGSANIDTNSRLCMASSVAGHKRAFGTDTVPGTYEDLEEADLVVLTGSNLAWCHPVLYQRLVAAKAARPHMRVVVIDPRRTATCDIADLHLPVAPGGDVALFNGLLAAIDDAGAMNAEFLSHVDGVEAAVAEARASDLSATGISPADLRAFYDLWIGTGKVVTVYSQGVNQSSAGADKVNAILNCHLATGRIGQPGMGPFSVTGQPNAMGGREVGGLANMLASHMDLENADHRSAVRGFWDSSAVADTPGLKAVDMFRAVGEGRIKALWIMHTNPAVTLPDADRVREAIAGCDFVVVSDITGATDTARLADLLLPATGWAEKSGTVTNSDRTISRQRKVLEAPGEARPDWQHLTGFAARMGWGTAFDYASPAEIFREYAALSGIAGGFGLDFDISGLSDISDAGYESLSPTRWPVAGARQGGRFFGDGRFFTPSGKGRMLPVTPRGPVAQTTAEHPFRLNTGRIRDQWHTMTRSGRSAKLSAHLAEPFLEIHPSDAAAKGISPSDLVEVTSPHGRAILRAFLTEKIRPGDIFAPMHWTGETAPSGRIDALVAPVVDPVSGQPESKAAVAQVARWQAGFYGFAISDSSFTPEADYWARARTAQGWRAEIAHASCPEDWEVYARDLFQIDGGNMQIVSDPARGTFRAAFVEEGRLRAAFFAAPEPVAVMRDYLSALPGTDAPMVLSGRAGADQPDPGPVLCSCFGIGVNTILNAIGDQRLVSVEAIGEALGAGTNCGSCRPELADLLARLAPREAAE
ncbi:assimilatory nitrate reductase (NADH) alpha subunit apoprotein [Pseudooceanicola antarcticus]|uniref:Nitrate reductase n=1 Tax=Pseudooceanicola antarcticus TaxID=1247613 RepID=A0A285HUG8_9RHOB|nr:nitrate reductase [Pseudooceanicola antarcticus]PJE27494.1 nitrate reductase [Pseudooceanicola antarcticus]SNY39350.1 assimilatory nitrate reductase (NADH) alpha subunit apoprotein [Pseudooceanicola antarcticus]